MAGALNPNSSSLSEQNCSFLSSVNLYLVVVALTGLPLNVLPWIVCYSRLRTHRNSRDMLLAALILVDFLTICIPLPIYLSMYANCSKSPPIQPFQRPTICEMFHLMYIWLKLGALFIITTLNYTSYLAVTSRGIYRSIGDRISSSFSCSANEQMASETRKKSVVIANLVVGIALVAFLIASLPYLGLGPEGKLSAVETNIQTNPLCCLEQISYPRQNKEYTFLFALLMSSSACFLLQIVHNISSCFSCSKDAVSDSSTNTSRSWNIYNRRLGAERNYAKMICVLGLTFHLTWIPVMVAVGGIMSGHQIAAEFSQYVIAGSFLPPSLEPVLYAVFLLDFREGYMAILRTIPARILGRFKECTVMPVKSETPVTTTNATTTGQENGHQL